MRKQILLLVLGVGLTAAAYGGYKYYTYAEGRCNPKGKCTACKNCSACRHCHHNGGTCSVCR